MKTGTLEGCYILMVVAPAGFCDEEFFESKRVFEALGAVVEVYDAEAIEVEFVRASGKTQAVVTLTTDAVRPVLDNDLVAVRSVASDTAAASG